MEKKLTLVGNSYALIIDRPVIRLMSLGATRRVSLRCEGKRLVVEAVRDELPTTIDARVARQSPLTEEERLNGEAVVYSLLNQHQMTDSQFRRLYPTGPAVPFRFQVRASRISDDDDEGIAAIRRMEVCRRQLKAGRLWNEAIAVALYAVPLATPEQAEKSPT